MALNPVYPVELFFDGDCPLCIREVAWLAARSSAGRLQLLDVNTLESDDNLPGRAELLAILHARDAAGNWYRGVDATVAVWQAAGVGARVAWLRWPLIYPVARWTYGLFARHRVSLARLFGARVCDQRCRGAARRQLADAAPDKR